MRADRLVAILLLLQARGKVTAAEVAAELEVSERTARRDLDALGVAGLPIYSRQGRGGGWELAGGGRTDLSGLTAAEARALFLVAGPSSATPEVKAALRKLVRALPEPFREHAEAASTAVVVDPTGWGQRGRSAPTPPHLDAVQRAVVGGEQVTLGYVARDRTASRRDVHPLGLAAKGTVWYLVADTDAGLRTFRVDRITAVDPTGRPVIRPDGFDLAEAWRLITDEVEQRRAPAQARVMAAPADVGLCRWVFGNRVRIGPAGADGRVELDLRGESPRSLAWELAGFGALLEVVEPPELCGHLARIGAELGRSYGPPARTLPPVAAVIEFIGGINRGDVDGLRAMMTDDHTLQVLDESPLVGREASTVAWRSYLDAFPRYIVHPHEVAADGGRVAVLGHTTGSHLGRPDDEERRIPVIWVADVEGGLLRRWRVLDDSPGRRRDLGLRASP